MNDDATQFSYFRDNELTQLADTTIKEDNSTKALDEGTIFLNKYKILKVLGEGSFSLIYLLEAIDASKKLLVAKEFFPKGFVTRNANNEVILKTSLTEKEIENYHFMKDIFIGEAQNLVKVSKRTHPNVLNFFALEENINNTMYLITDYEEGMTLKAYIKERKHEHKGKLTNQEIVDIGAGLLTGLSHIHKVEVYHQDIKLENILLRHDQSPLLLDFGASILLYDEKQKKYFNATTPRYAAPEQVELAQPPKIDQRTDIYELGVLLYKLITDEFPPKATERLKAQEEYKDSYIALETQKPYGYSMNVLKAVDRALELEPENRFQNADDFKRVLIRKESSSKFIQSMLLVLVPLFFGLLYMFWPQSKGTAKLNIEQKKYFVYSDGKKIPLSEEKTILLGAGQHQLTIIKDGYIPHEVNVTIRPNSIVNVSAKLVPLSHRITLTSNVTTATFMVNGKQLPQNTFEGEAGKTYTIRTSAEHYVSEVNEINYMHLYKNNFKFYQALKAESKQIKLMVNAPFNLGKSKIKVNGKTLNSNMMLGVYNKSYVIDIENPYYKKVHFVRTYEELSTNEQKITLTPGEGEVILKGLPEGVTLHVYKKSLDKIEQVNSQFSYLNKVYKATIVASEKVYIEISKKGYTTLKTDMFNIQDNGRYSKTYVLRKNTLKKEDVSKKTEVTSSVDTSYVETIHKITSGIQKDTVIKEKTPEIKSNTLVNKNVMVSPIKHQKSIHRSIQNDRKNLVKENTLTSKKVNDTIKSVKMSKPSKKENIKIMKYKIKKGDTLSKIAILYHTTIAKLKRENRIEGKAVLKVGKVLDVPVGKYFKKKRTTFRKKEVVKIKNKKNVKRTKNIKRQRSIKNKKTLKKKRSQKRERRRYHQKKSRAAYLWYCVASADGTQTWSAKSSTKRAASSVALRQCRRRKGARCRVASCYILGGS